MGKLIYLANVDFTEEQVNEVRDVALSYDVLSFSEPEIDLSEVEILFSAPPLANKILSLPNHSLKWVQSVSAGVDSFHLAEFKKQGVLLSNTSGLHAPAIAEHVITMLLTQLHGVKNWYEDKEKHLFNQSAFRVNMLSGMKMLIVGTGHIGVQLGKLTQALGVRTYGVNSTGHSAENFIQCYSLKNWQSVLSEMDIVVNILPLTPTTEKLYNHEVFDKMKDSAIFVNVGRGKSVDEKELIEVLQQKKISFAALDVFEKEPLPSDSPLWTLENVLITPHVSGVVPNFKKNILQGYFLPNLRSYLETGKLVINQVNLDKGY
ncbi:MAG: hydroxyacid dehydrogenase [Lactobacillales bacterium]|jgi:phosphoglycerate dehydrogenase-like enzyme|nr:hydroxyacid dehydrogenase [Lactobacillales bacterium]